jgi:hypothetical protein
MKKLIFCLFLFSTVVSLNAQTKETSTFTPNVYVAAYGGLSALIAKDNNLFQSSNTLSFSNNVKWGSAVAVGYDFSPILGVRWELGYSQNKWKDNLSGVVDKFWLESLTADLMINLTNCIWGYNSERIIDVQAFVGGGGGITDYISNSRGDIFTPIVRVGLQGSYHLNQNIDISLELAANGVSNNYNDATGGSFFDGIPTAMAGISYHFR